MYEGGSDLSFFLLFVSLARASLLEVLLKRLDPAQTHLGKRCVAIETTAARPVLHFKDGTSAEADVVLVANGVKSQLREVVTGVPSSKSVSYSNTVCYRGLVVKEEAVAKGVDTSSWTVPSTVIGVGKVCLDELSAETIRL